MSIPGKDVKLSSFSVGEAGTNVTTITFGHYSGRLLAAGSEDSIIYVYKINPITSLFSSHYQSSAITALRFSSDETVLAAGTRSGVVKICDLESQKVIHPGGHKTCIRSIEYFPSSNNILATGAIDGTVKVWDTKRQGFIFNCRGHNGAINALKFSPDGRYLLTASDDAAIQMWDLTAGKVIKAFQEHQGPVFTIEYHPKELLFASAGADKRIKFWDLEKLQFICETEIEPSTIKCLAFEPINGNDIFSGSDDALHVHSWEPIQLLDTIQMNWKNILDMTIHNSQLLGASALQNEVHISSIDLSNLNTKPPISPTPAYSSKRSEQPELSNAINSDESPSQINVFEQLSKGNQTINSIQQQRMRHLILLNNLSRRDSPQKNFQEILKFHDLSLECFFIHFVNEKLSKHDWNLDLCTSILPAVRDLLQSSYHWYNLIACQALEKVLTNFGKMIYSTVGAKPIGIDLAQPDKYQSCQDMLHEIRSLMEDRSKNLDDSSLKQAFTSNLRLVNIYQRT